MQQPHPCPSAHVAYTLNESLQRFKSWGLKTLKVFDSIQNSRVLALCSVKATFASQPKILAVPVCETWPRISERCVRYFYECVFFYEWTSFSGFAQSVKSHATFTSMSPLPPKRRRHFINGHPIIYRINQQQLLAHRILPLFEIVPNRLKLRLDLIA